MDELGQTVARLICAGLAAAMLASVPLQAQEPAIRVRLVRPGEQVGRVIDLFEGSRCHDPAAALAAWKRTQTGPPLLTKRGEVLIALFNPAMAAELKTLDDAFWKVDAFEPETGRARWHAVVPGDDGTFAALVTALTLTSGAQESPMIQLPVFRLGGIGSPLAASAPDRLAIGSTRAELRDALHEQITKVNTPTTAESGVDFRVIPRDLHAAHSLMLKRMAAAMRVYGGRDSSGHFGLERDTLGFRLVSRFDKPRPVRAGVSQAWLDAVPATRTVVAFAIAIDSSPRAIDEVFAVADAVEKADPARARVAPLRSRLNLLATVARVRPEEWWPRLKGISGFLLAADRKRPNGGALVIHTVDAESAQRLANDVFPKLLSHYRPGDHPKPALGLSKPPDPRIDGQVVTLEAHGPQLWLFWGPDARTLARKAASDPAHSAGAVLRSTWGGTLPHRAGAFWPGRSRILDDPDSAMAVALANAPPVIWRGYDDGATLLDDLAWPRLKPLVARLLETLPLDPPPHH